MIFFRADGNSKIGAGHVMRCLSIADSAREMGEKVIFYTAGDDFSHIIQEHDIENIVIQTDFMEMESELVLLKQEIMKNRPSIVLVDSYFVTTEYLRTLLDCCHIYGGKLVYLDDVLAFAYPCDFLINYNIYGPDKLNDYLKMYEDAGIKKETKGFPVLLLGPEFVPLRKEFFNIPKRVRRDNRSKILISTGGADFAHIALSMVKKIIAMKSSDIGGLQFHILIGAMNGDKTEIEHLAEGYDSIKLHYNVKDMLGLILECDIAISAAGSTLYELYATQTPTITYVVADNQIMGAEGFSKAGIMEYAGDVRNLGEDKMAQLLLNKAISLAKNMDASVGETRLISNGPRNIIENIKKYKDIERD